MLLGLADLKIGRYITQEAAMKGSATGKTEARNPSAQAEAYTAWAGRSEDRPLHNPGGTREAGMTIRLCSGREARRYEHMGGWSLGAEKIAGEEGQVGGALGQAAHEIGEPFLAVRDVDSETVAV